MSGRDIKIYPNPTTDFISLSNLNFNNEFEIYDILGNRISNGNLTEEIDVTNLSAGIYFF